MRRRDFITLLGGAATWPLVARAQDRIRRIGVLSAFAENDPEARGNVTAFRQALEKLGWTDGGNVRIDYRWGGADVERIRAHAIELIGLKPDVILVSSALGFVALIGVISLIGLDVRNSIVLMVQVDAEIAEGRERWDAVVEATVHRFRPILLTASAAALGIIPIAGTVFWGPFAFAVIGGLMVATTLTLVFLPALYVLWFRVKEPVAAESAVAEQVAV
jgi:AcrB/AcrD/AcrF family